MSFYQQVLETRRTALNGMFSARDMYERAKYMALYRWACEEIKRHYTGATVSAG